MEEGCEGSRGLNDSDQAADSDELNMILSDPILIYAFTVPGSDSDIHIGAGKYTRSHQVRGLFKTALPNSSLVSVESNTSYSYSHPIY